MGRSRKVAPRLLVAVAALYWTVVLNGSSCEDPPPPPGSGALILGIRTVIPGNARPRLSGGARETLIGLTGLRATVMRVDVVHRTVVNDPSTEQVITVDDTPHTFELTGDLKAQAPQQLGFVNIPAGFVFQIRLVTEAAEIMLRGNTFRVNIPSGPKTGFKIIPIDGVPFEIRAGERSGARIVLNPFHQLIRSRKQGFKMKPVVEAEHVTVEQLTPFLFDRLLVGFKKDTTRARIDELNAQIGTSVIAFDAWTNFFILRIPISLSLKDALNFYDAQSEVEVALPDAPGRIQTIPCDGLFQNPGPFTDVDAPQAWTFTQGTRKSLLAVVDTGFDLRNPDILPNYYINQGEFTGYLVNHTDLLTNFSCEGHAGCDCNNDGTVDEAEIVKCLDTDHDDLITFVDLNDSRNAGLVSDLDGDTVITPLDLVDGMPGNVGFEDGLDNDNDGLVDDLVGWDFGDNDNLPQHAAESQCLTVLPDQLSRIAALSHGTSVAGIMAAVGAPPPVPPARCASGGVAGMNWVGRLLPLKSGSDSKCGVGDLQGNAILAFNHAARLHADAINYSIALVPVRGPVLCGNTGDASLGGKFDNYVQRLKDMTATTMDLGNSVLVVPAPNCVYNLDQDDVFSWPAEVSNPNIVVVGGVNTTVCDTNRCQNFANLSCTQESDCAVTCNGDPMPCDGNKAGTCSHNGAMACDTDADCVEQHTMASFSGGAFGPNVGSAFGPNTVKIAAPANFFTLYDFEGGFSPEDFGNSFASPLVAGTVGLIVANGANPPIQDNASTVISRLLCNARVVPDLADKIGNGRVLDVCASVRNAQHCP